MTTLSKTNKEDKWECQLCYIEGRIVKIVPKYIAQWLVATEVNIAQGMEAFRGNKKMKNKRILLRVWWPLR